MKWEIKDKVPKSPEGFIRKRFALLPTRVQRYWIWLEPYYYYCYPPDYTTDSKQKVKFLDYKDCLTHISFDISRGVTVV